MNRVVHFEISADDTNRAVKFYKEVFGWKIEKWDSPMEYWLVTTGEQGEPGINGAIQPRSDPKATTVNTISVGSVKDYAGKVVAGGGKLTTSVEPIPEVGYFIMCEDTEGNPFGLLEEDMNAMPGS